MNIDNSNLKRLICIEYPGLVKNVDNMLKTLGGIDELSRICSNTSLRLQLKFRPNDPFSHCAIGDRVQLNNLLVKTIKKKITYEDETFEYQYETKIIGIIESTYKFNTLADFQFLPMKRTNFNAKETIDKILTINKLNINNNEINELINNLDDNQNNDNREQNDNLNDELINQINNNNLSSITYSNDNSSYKSISKDVFPNDPLNGEIKKFNKDSPLFVMPIIFSRFDTPSDYFYKNDTKSRCKDSTTKYDNLGAPLMNISRKSRSRLVFLLTFNDEPIKERPLSEEDELVDKFLLNKIRKEFEEQPIWSKIELAYRNKCKKIELKSILPLVSFYYTNGPFRGQWVRFGYNIKENPECRFYQTLDLRTTFLVNKSLSRENSKPITKTTYKTIKGLSNEKKAKDVKILNNGNLTETETANTNQQYSNIHSFKYMPDFLPNRKQIMYQLKNIELKEVQDIIKNSKVKDQCDEKDGWFPTGTIDKIRSITLASVDKLLTKQSNANKLNDNLIDKETDELEIDDEEIDYMEQDNEFE